MDYEYDVFVSYKRNGAPGRWVCELLKPVLEECLVEELRDPKLFFDLEQHTGTRWPDNICRALRRSKVLLAVWSGEYFDSPWCLAEWRSMLERQRVLGMWNASNPDGLVYAIKFADGIRFPPDALATQIRFDFEELDLNYPELAFKKGSKAMKFRFHVRKLAKELAAHIRSAPPWQDDWPIVRPDAPPAADFPLPSL